MAEMVNVPFDLSIDNTLSLPKKTPWLKNAWTVTSLALAGMLTLSACWQTTEYQKASDSFLKAEKELKSAEKNKKKAEKRYSDAVREYSDAKRDLDSAHKKL